MGYRNTGRLIFCAQSSMEAGSYKRTIQANSFSATYNNYQVGT